MPYYVRDSDDKTSDLDLDYDWDHYGENDPDPDPTILFTETESSDSVMWKARHDGSIYMETRGIGSPSTVSVIPKDEAIALMEWLSRFTK